MSTKQHVKDAASAALHSLGEKQKQFNKPSINIPSNGFPVVDALKAEKTPADEGIDFFESAIIPGEQPIRVYELKLSPEGGPEKNTSVRFHHAAYKLCILSSIDYTVHTSGSA